MKKNLIAAGVAAFVGSLGLVGGASAGVWGDDGAATISPTNAGVSLIASPGRGHQLIVPYYNVQAGNSTLINIVNTDVTNGKAVKVRFRGGSNSDDVFDFQVLMSPGDVWTAQLTQAGDGRALLSTNDKSCTIPAAVGKDSGGPNSLFVTARLPSTLTDAQKARETREGYVEIFNMADIPPRAINTADGAELLTANALFTAIKHVDGVAPCTTATINTLAVDPASLADAYGLGFRAPTGTLFGNYAIVNVPKAGTATGDMIGIVAASGLSGDVFNMRGNIVFFPQTGAAAPTPDLFTSDPSLRTVAGGAPGQVSDGVEAAPAAYAGTTPIITASMFDLPDLSTPYLSLGAYPPAATDPGDYVVVLQLYALATLSVTNEYLTDPNINAATDWTFSQPTRRYAVAPDYRPLASGGAMGRAFQTFGLIANFPFYSSTSTAVSGFQICVNTAGVTYWDREERTAVGSSFVISPNPPAAVFRLCGETSVLTFNSTGTSVLGAEIARTNFSTGAFRDGWANVSIPGPQGVGIPVIGKSFSNASTGTLNIGGAWEHRYQRLVLP